MKAYWRQPTAEYRESLYAAFSPAATRYQYIQGVSDPSMVSPDGSTLDDYYLARTAFRHELPDAEVRLLDTGHFALETHCDEIAKGISEFMERQTVVELVGNTERSTPWAANARGTSIAQLSPSATTT